MLWAFAFALPNIVVPKPIETRYIALVPPTDKRVASLRHQHRSLDIFLKRFSDSVGKRSEPSVLIAPNRLPRTMRTGEAFAAFRDAVALSIVPLARAQLLVNRAARHKAPFSNSFDFYPWMFDPPDRILLRTLAHSHIHEARYLRPQNAPELAVHTLSQFDIDQPLLDRLLREWVLCFKIPKPSPYRVALFRSLNVANQAARMPGSVPVTLYDVGRLMILWASAFEILAHPGASQNVSLYHVYALLEKVRWETVFCRRKTHVAYGSKKDMLSKVKRVAACWLYGHIHQLRNDFVHGNPVNYKNLAVQDARGELWMHAAPLYRLALTAYLDLKPDPSLKLKGGDDHG